MPELMSALITPFKKNQEVDYNALQGIVKQQIADGCDGFIVCGTTAETPTLSHEERMRILDMVIKLCEHKKAIWYGCGSNYTKAAIQACKEVETLDINGVLLVTPYYNCPSQEGIYQHFKAIDKAINTSIMLYNIPSRTGSELSLDTLSRLLHECTHIKALKHATSDLTLVKGILKEYPDFHIYSGEDCLFEEGFDVGMCGLISVMSHISLKALKEFCKERKDENLRSFLKECAKMTFIDSSPSPIKYMLAKQGRCENVLRLPMCPVSQAVEDKINTWMTENDNFLK